MNYKLASASLDGLAIVGTIGILQNSNSNSDQVNALMKAARTGRQGRQPCSKIYDFECGTRLWNRLRGDKAEQFWMMN